MKKITETTLLNSVNSLRELMNIVNEASPIKTIGGSEHPMQDFTDYMTTGTANAFKKDANDWGVDRFGGGVDPTSIDPTKALAPNFKTGRGGHTPPLGLTNPEQYPDISPAGEFNLPHPTLPPHEFNPSDTSHAQDYPPVDDLSGPSDIDKVVPKQSTALQTAAKPHPAGQPKTPKPKFDPAVQKKQYELIAKGYPIKADGILGPQTQKAIDWEKQSAARDASINDYSALQATMDEPITAPEPGENTQGDFDRMPELNEHVTFSNDDSLARIIQLARGQ